MVYEHECEYCNRYFTSTVVNQKYCCEGCKQMAKQRARRIKKNPQTEEHQREITRLTMEAAAAGMSYGKYVAMMGRKRNGK